MNSGFPKDDTVRKPDLRTTAGGEGGARRSILAGLLVRRESWCLSWRGKLAGLLLALSCVGALTQGLPSFLAVTNPSSTEVLVLEGWMPAYAVNQVTPLIKARDYQRVIISRPLYAGRTEYESGEALAKYLLENLTKLGVPKERIHLVFSNASDRNRTYRSALAVRNWFQEQGLEVRTIDVGTMGPHARRSRLLFQRAFGKDVKVGVVAFEDQDYDLAHWWRSSAGVREVPFELVAYLYVKFFFSPPKSGIGGSDAPSPQVKKTASVLSSDEATPPRLQQLQSRLSASESLKRVQP